MQEYFVLLVIFDTCDVVYNGPIDTCDVVYNDPIDTCDVVYNGPFLRSIRCLQLDFINYFLKLILCL